MAKLEWKDETSTKTWRESGLSRSRLLNRDLGRLPAFTPSAASFDLYRVLAPFSWEVNRRKSVGDPEEKKRDREARAERENGGISNLRN